MKKLLSLLILLSLTGCVRYYKPGAGQAEFNADSAFCEMNAYKFAPPAVERVVIRGAYQEPTQTNCSGNINMQENGTASRGTYYGNTNGTITNNCITTGGKYVPPATVDIDNNQSARNAAYKNCLFQKGWSTVKPAEVKPPETKIENTRKSENPSTATSEDSDLPLLKSYFMDTLPSTWEYIGMYPENQVKAYVNKSSISKVNGIKTFVSKLERSDQPILLMRSYSDCNKKLMRITQSVQSIRSPIDSLSACSTCFDTGKEVVNQPGKWISLPQGSVDSKIQDYVCSKN
jgi:hypothetical protein